MNRDEAVKTIEGLLKKAGWKKYDVYIKAQQVARMAPLVMAVEGVNKFGELDGASASGQTAGELCGKLRRHLGLQ